MCQKNMRLDRLLNFMFRTGRGISVMLFSVLAGAVLAGGCSLSYDTSVGYIVDAYYIDETTGEVVFGNAAGHFDRPHGDPCRVFL